MAKRLLLGSGGFTTPDRQQGWRESLDSFLGPLSRILFIPYALNDYEAYVEKMIEKGFHAGRELIAIHREKDAIQAVEAAEAIYVGGGNSFRLLDKLYKLGLLQTIRNAVLNKGVPYIGVSAGTNMACPTLKTTNDMPIVQPSQFEALGLVGFQINPHYFSGAIHYQTPSGLVEYGGETRDDRIREFHEMNEVPVLGLWEGAVLRVEGTKYTLAGTAGARFFRKRENPVDYVSGSDLSDLLK